MPAPKGASSAPVVDADSYIFWYALWAVRRRRAFDKRWRIPKQCVITSSQVTFETLAPLQLADITRTKLIVQKLEPGIRGAYVKLYFSHQHPVHGQILTLDIFPTAGSDPEEEAQAFLQVLEAFRHDEHPSVDPHPWRRSHRAAHRMVAERDLESITQPPYSHEPPELGWIALLVIIGFIFLIVLYKYLQ